MVPAYEVIKEVIEGPAGQRIESELEKVRAEMNAYIDGLIAEGKIRRGEPVKVYITSARGSGKSSGESEFYEKYFATFE